MRRAAALGLLLAALGGPPSALGQATSLASAGERARASWFRHDAGGLVASAPRVLVQLPGADPSAPVERAQAAALLREFLAGSEEVQTDVRAAREVSPGRGYVELVREYRVRGTDTVRRQSVLLGYRKEGNRWVLTELRITRE